MIGISTSDIVLFDPPFVCAAVDEGEENDDAFEPIFELARIALILALVDSQRFNFLQIFNGYDYVSR